MGIKKQISTNERLKSIEKDLVQHAMSIFYVGRNNYTSTMRLEAVISLLIEKGIITEEELNNMVEENKKEFETQEQKEKDEDIQKVIQESKSEGENSNEKNI